MLDKSMNEGGLGASHESRQGTFVRFEYDAPWVARITGPLFRTLLTARETAQRCRTSSAAGRISSAAWPLSSPNQVGHDLFLSRGCPR